MNVTQINKGQRFLQQIVALWMIVVLLVATPITAGAVDEVTAQEMVYALETLQQELSAATKVVDSFSEAPDTVPKETNEGLTEIDISAAQDDLLNQCQLLVSSVIEKINGKQRVYLHRDLLEYVEKFSSCIRVITQTRDFASQIKANITACKGLGEELQQSLLSAVRITADSMDDWPFGELADNLNVAEQWTCVINYEQVDIWRNSLQQQDEVMRKQYNALIALLPDLAKAKQTLDKVEAVLSGESGKNSISGGGALTTSVNTLQVLCNEKKVIVEDLMQYADKGPEEQAALLERVENLCGRIDPALAECLAESVQENRTLSFTQRGLKNQIGNLEGKLLFLYIALGLAAISLVLGIAALLVGLNKSKVITLEKNILKIEQQVQNDTEKLYTTQKKLDKRIEQISLDMGKPTAAEQDIAELKRIVEGMHRELVKLTDNSRKKQEYEKTDDGLKPVDALHLDYNAVAPKMSLLLPDEKGEYLRYSDNSIAPAVLHQTNTVGSWQSMGLLYLFDLEWNGSVVNPTSLGDSYYEIIEVAQRAEFLEKNSVAKKGKLRIRKIS